MIFMASKLQTIIVLRSGTSTANGVFDIHVAALNDVLLVCVVTQRTSCCSVEACPDVKIPFGSFEGEFQPGKNLSFSCNPGFALTGVATLTCRQDATWSGEVPKCMGKCQLLVYCSYSLMWKSLLAIIYVRRS